jgi:nucleoside 2-deoxyribosyltransferase
VLTTQDNFQQLASGHMRTSVSVKLRRALEYLARRSRRPGDKVEIEHDIWPMFDAVESGEVTYLLTTLTEQGYIVDATGSRWQITAKSWEHLEPTAPGGIPGTCFVAMSFDPALDPAYDLGIRPATEHDCGMRVVRVDRVEHNGIVTDLILASIRAAQLVVADVTLQRSGVYFEAGFALGLLRIVVWTCRNDDLKNVHFDTRQYSHVVWADPADLRVRLVNRIHATLLTLRHGVPPTPRRGSRDQFETVTAQTPGKTVTLH